MKLNWRDYFQLGSLVVICLLIFILFISQSCHGKQVDELNRNLSIANAASYGYEIVETENMSLRQLLRTRDEPLVLTKVERIVETKIITVEKEKVVTIPVSPEHMVYNYVWDTGLIVARYEYNGAEHNFITPKVDITIETELDGASSVSSVWAVSSSEPQRRVLINSTSADMTVINNESGVKCKWCWFVGGTLIGGATVAGSVKLAGELR